MDAETAYIDPRIAFWSSPQSWPDKSPTHLFLGDVVHQVGKTFYGDGWTGTEPQTELVVPLPQELHASVNSVEIRRACRLLFEHDPEYRARCPQLAEYLLNWPIPTPEEWARAVTLTLSLAEARRSEFSRYIEVCQRLAYAFKHGRILTATRGIGGGQEYPQDRYFWNTENFWERFATCQVDVLEPFRPALVPATAAYIYVDRVSLTRVLTAEPADSERSSIQISPDEYLSPYLSA